MNLLVSPYAAFRFTHRNNISYLKCLYVKPHNDELEYRITFTSDIAEPATYPIDENTEIKLHWQKPKNYNEALAIILNNTPNLKVVL